MLLLAWFGKIISFSNKKIIIRETQAVQLKTNRETQALKIAIKLADSIIFLSEEDKLQIQMEMGNMMGLEMGLRLHN